MASRRPFKEEIIGWCGVCPHCRRFYAGNMGEAMKHNPKCASHLFCKNVCSKGRAVFIEELADKIAAKLRTSKRGDLGRAILSLLSEET